MMIFVLRSDQSATHFRSASHLKNMTILAQKIKRNGTYSPVQFLKIAKLHLPACHLAAEKTLFFKKMHLNYCNG